VQPTKFKLKRLVLTRMLLLGLAFSVSAEAAVINPSLNEFILTNTAADGSVVIANDGLSFVLTGGNTGSGDPGTTDFTVSARNSGTVEFFYSYATLDPSTGFDVAGYLLGSTRVPLADSSGESGFGSFLAVAGQTYGWYVSTLDNTGEPGILTVTFTPAASPVPEPAGFAFTLTGIAVLAVKIRRLSPVHSKERNS
jgi:hypothetical protein